MASKKNNPSYDFLDAVIGSLPVKKTEKDLAILVVTHCVQSILPMLDGLETFGDIRAIILKGSHQDRTIFYLLNEKFSTQLYGKKADSVAMNQPTPDEAWKIMVNREYLKNKDNVYAFFAEVVLKPNYRKFVIIDIGGYFAQAAVFIAEHDELKRRCCGIVEDTKNGFRKYLEIMRHENLPRIAYIGRSLMKADEDENVGIALSRACDAIMTENGERIFFVSNVNHFFL